MVADGATAGQRDGEACVAEQNTVVLRRRLCSGRLGATAGLPRGGCRWARVLSVLTGRDAERYLLRVNDVVARMNELTSALSEEDNRPFAPAYELCDIQHRTVCEAVVVSAAQPPVPL
jgi:hypothetical protein